MTTEMAQIQPSHRHRTGDGDGMSLPCCSSDRAPLRAPLHYTSAVQPERADLRRCGTDARILGYSSAHPSGIRLVAWAHKQRV